MNGSTDRPSTRNKTRNKLLSWKLWLFWCAAAVAIPIWAANDPPGWDFKIYGKALESLQAHRDPYQDATDVQKRLNAERLAHPTTGGVVASSYSYVYSPITLPPLRLLGHVPVALLVILYWLAYIAGTLGAIAVGASFATEDERRGMLYAAAVAPFLPGLLSNEAVLSGNIAYILYGALFGALLLGWRRQTWWCFYVLVWLAACVKAPLLSLALIPALSARRQWTPSIATVAIGAATFALQPVIWPVLFRHYLEAVELQFSINQDFGSSLAGLFSQVLARRGLPYAPVSYFVYLAYAAPLFAALVYFSRLYLRGAFPLKQWAPVLLVGIVVLNPRIMEYDTAPVTVLLALIAWRLTAATTRPRLWLTLAFGAFIVMNAAAIYSWQLRKAIDGPLVMLLLVGGLLNLLRQHRASVGQEPAWTATARHPPMVS